MNLADDEVADLSEQHDESRRDVVVLGVGPGEADDVEQRRGQVFAVVEVRLPQVVRAGLHSLQVDVHVLRLCQRYTHEHIHIHTINI